MQPIVVVKHGYVIQHILLCVDSGLVISPVNPFLLQASEETFCNFVIPAIYAVNLRWTVFGTMGWLSLKYDDGLIVISSVILDESMRQVMLIVAEHD